jgi:hypothetical protein
MIGLYCISLGLNISILLLYNNVEDLKVKIKYIIPIGYARARTIVNGRLLNIP